MTSPLRSRVLPGVDRRADVAVGREADVVEHDLVEARSGGGGRDRDGVVPDAPVVRVDPRQSRVRRPDRAVRPLDRESGACGRGTGPGRRRPGRSGRCPSWCDRAGDLAGLRSSSGRRPSLRASGTPAGTNAISPPSSLTSSSIVLRPCFVERDVLRSLPGSDASAPVTCTPRTSTGSGRGRVATWSWPGGAGRELRCRRAGIPSSSLSRRASSRREARRRGGRAAATAARRRRFRRRTASRRARKRSFGCQGWYSMDTGSSSLVGRLRTSVRPGAVRAPAHKPPPGHPPVP
jgi:hypothetical protein